MKAAQLRAADDRMLKVHARWLELCTEYLNRYGALSMGVLHALFDVAEGEMR